MTAGRGVVVMSCMISTDFVVTAVMYFSMATHPEGDFSPLGEN